MATTKYQRAYSKRKRAQGLCTYCGKEPLVGKSGYGLYCLTIRRERAREKKGLKPWKRGKGGAIPTEYRIKETKLWIKKMRKFCDQLEEKLRG